MPDRKGAGRAGAKAAARPAAKTAARPAAKAAARPAAASEAGAASPVRLEVRKTYKLFIGGAFPRSESGRSYPVTAADGRLLAHAARASDRKSVV